MAISETRHIWVLTETHWQVFCHKPINSTFFITLEFDSSIGQSKNVRLRPIFNMIVLIMGPYMGVKGFRTKGIPRDRTRLYTKSTFTQWLIDIVIPNSMC